MVAYDDITQITALHDDRCRRLGIEFFDTAAAL